jgi:uncharacterized protein (TIGR03492 family)
MAESKILFVTNGHGEAAIAARIVQDLRSMSDAGAEHFPLVGRDFGIPGFTEVGPRAVMPSGGLVAMGNAGKFIGDLRAGFVPLWGKQVRFLQSLGDRYAAVVAVGDAYALFMARMSGIRAIFVGTAKSEYVASYGWVERRIMRGARAIFVRDRETANALAAHHLTAAVANVIVDLAAGDGPPVPWSGAERLVLLPGSREDAYLDAALLVRVVRVLAAARPVSAVLSIAPSVDGARVAAGLEAEGWRIDPGSGPVEFSASIEGKHVLSAMRSELRSLFPGATLALGQAGTANEAAAASGLPVVALETQRSGRSSWYRMRQARLLGAALEVVPGDPPAAAAAVARLLDDPQRCAEMAATGRARMGPPGGAAIVARAIAELAARAS